jgi:hypothetical protein
MPANSQKIIVINGVRYNVAIRLDANWRYVAEWWNTNEYHKHMLDGSVQSTSTAEQEAIDKIHQAHLEKEPWLYAELAGAEEEESYAGAGIQ